MKDRNPYALVAFAALVVSVFVGNQEAIGALALLLVLAIIFGE